MSWRGERRGGRRGARGGPSISDADLSWRSPVPIAQQSGQTRGRGQPIERNVRGRKTYDSSDLVDAERFFAAINKDVKLALDLSNVLDSHDAVNRLLSESIVKLEGLTISWSNHVEDFVLFLKRLCISRDERFLSLHYFVPMDIPSSEGTEPIPLCEKFPGRACQLLQIISNGLIPGKDSYSLLHLLVSKTSSNSYALAQLFGFKATATANEGLKLHHSLPYKSLLDVVTCLIGKSKEILAFAERKSLFAVIEGSYTSFSQDMACILEDLIHLAIKLIVSTRDQNSTNNSHNLTRGVERVMLLELAEATPFSRLPSSLIRYLCRFLDELYLSSGGEQLCSLSRRVLAVLMQNEGVKLEDLKSVFQIKEIKLEDEKIRSVFGNEVLSISASSIFQDFLNSLTTAFSAIDHRDIGSDKLIMEYSAVSEYMKIFVGLAKYHFMESMLTCRHIFNVAIPILVRSRHFEQLVRDRSFQGSILEEKLGNCLPGVTIKFLTSFIAAVSEYVKGEFDGDYVSIVGEQWFSIIQLFPDILDLGSWTLGCLALDAMSAVHEELFSRLSVEAQERTLAFIVKVGGTEKHRTEIRAKSGRCLALMFDFQMLVEQSEPLWFTLNCIGRSLNSENMQVRTSWAWALGKWSDALEKHHRNGEIPNELESRVLHVLKLIHICSHDVLKMRYNGYRTASNVFKWMPDAALEYPTIRKEITNTLDTLISQIGHGTDYKARWNAVYAVGCVFENTAIMSEMDSSILVQTLPCLWTWVAQSQNYKERIQCAVAIRKIQSRGLFKENYHTVLNRVCLSVARLPVEDIDLAQKLKCEVAITVAELASIMEPKDLSGMEQILSEHGECLKTLFLDTQEMIPSERKEAINRARDRVMSLRPHQTSDGVIETLCDILCDLSVEESPD